MIIYDLTDRILGRMGEPLDGTGFWSRDDILSVLSQIQREISQETRNIVKTPNNISVTASTSEITVDSSGNMLEVFSAYRMSPTERPIAVFTEEQIARYDPAWKTRTAGLIRGLLTDTAVEGKARVYPIPTETNTLSVTYIKLADEVTDDTVSIELPASDMPCLENGIKSFLYDMERDGKDAGKATLYRNLYISGKALIIDRIKKKRTGTYRVLNERYNYEDLRTRPYYPWEV